MSHEGSTHSEHTHSSHQHCQHDHDHSLAHEKHTRWVVYLTVATMFAEIFFGYATNSMSLLADGWHMASHVFALGITWMAYFFIRKYANSLHFTFNKKKLLALTGFTSAVALLIIAIWMAAEACIRLLHPMDIKFGEATVVATLGLIVNGLSALLLGHNHEHHDHNIRSAYLHVLADLLTSVAAIVALAVGFFFNLYWVDSVSGILSSFLIVKWSYDLIKASGKELADFHYTEH